MVLKRLTALFVVALMVAAAGCSSSKGKDDQASGSTSTTDTSLLDPSDPSATMPDRSSEPAEPLPVERAPDDQAFCTAFGDAQDLELTVAQVNFTDNASGLLAAPEQLRTMAQRLRVTAPDEIFDAADAYGRRFDETGNTLRAVTTLRELNAAVLVLNNAIDEEQVKPAVTWVVKNCVAGDPDAGFPAPDPEPA